MFRLRNLVILALVAVALTGCFGRKKYENPIDADTAQPDKALFDKAVADMERGRYRIARLTLQTLVNTYDTTEYMAKAKLALADTWFREGGSHGLAQAEAEYKDFILFYPSMEESAEAQSRVCMIHYRQMEKPDRDNIHAVRADDECRQLMVQFPNSKFVPEMEQRLREIQEVLAGHEYKVGSFYFKKGSYPATTNRLDAMVDHYPLFSDADEALWKLAESYSKMGPRFQEQSIEAYERIARDYPLSQYADQARNMLTDMEREIPDPDPVALARMEYEDENYKDPSRMSGFWGLFRKAPGASIRSAAKSGTPSSTPLSPSIPVSVPGQMPAPAGGVSADVTVSTVGEGSALDTQPDARRVQPNQQPPEQNQQ
jgi:outer membrane protein assembly factor BamD